MILYEYERRFTDFSCRFLYEIPRGNLRYLRKQGWRIKLLHDVACEDDLGVAATNSHLFKNAQTVAYVRFN